MNTINCTDNVLTICIFWDTIFACTKLKKQTNLTNGTYLLKISKQRSISIARRIERMEQGNFGDAKSIGDNLSELRIDLGPGYRVYYLLNNKEIIILLVGGDKSTQTKDITKAKEMAKEYKNA